MRKQKTKAKDSQLKEFEKRDLGEDIKKSGSAVVVRSKQVPTSVLLDPALRTQLQVKARKRGIGYQTMMKIIVRENIDKY